jgi:hypothetical protein
MRNSSDGKRQQGTIRMLLKNCLALLAKEKYPQVISNVGLFLFGYAVLKYCSLVLYSGNVWVNFM